MGNKLFFVRETGTKVNVLAGIIHGGYGMGVSGRKWQRMREDMRGIFGESLAHSWGWLSKG